MNNRALITGSSSGIGLEIAKTLAKSGYKIMLHGYNIENKEKIINEIRSFATNEVFCCDIDISTDAERLFEISMEKLGSIDVLINNAGIQHLSEIESFQKNKWDAVLNINLTSAFTMIQKALPEMKKNNYGRILNIASVHGIIASINKAAYVSSKHGLIGLTKVVALETAEFNITCNALCPGFVLTPLVKKQVEIFGAKKGMEFDEASKEFIKEKHPTKTFIEPSELALMAEFLCKPEIKSIRGASIVMDCGWSII